MAEAGTAVGVGTDTVPDHRVGLVLHVDLDEFVARRGRPSVHAVGVEEQALNPAAAHTVMIEAMVAPFLVSERPASRWAP